MSLKKELLRKQIRTSVYNLMRDGVERPFMYIFMFVVKDIKKEMSFQQFGQYLRSCKDFIKKVHISPSGYIFYGNKKL